MKKDSKETFIMKARYVHGDKYDYSKVEYKNSKEKICVICPEHGEFWITPNSHIRGCGCKFCGKNSLKSTQKIIEELKNIYGDKYDYSKVEYKGNKIKICIICPEHGEFWQKPGNHLYGHGCAKCMAEQNKINNMHTTTDFIRKAIEIHNDRYDYSLVEYRGSHEKVQIICPIHGVFWQDACGHLNGHGCPKCNKSKLEIEIENIYPNFIQQKKFDWLKYKLPMSLDFFIEDKQIAIECQGEQHFFLNPSSCFNGVDEIMHRDILKYQQCKEHNIEIIYYFPEEFLNYDVDFYKDKKCFHTINDLKNFLT